MATPIQLTRRHFLRQASASVALISLQKEAVARGTQPTASGTHVQRLTTGWEFRRGPMTLPQARADRAPWQPVSLPHCTNAADACDPDHPYFQGQSWYRLRLPVSNPYASGHTLLHFHGAGQTTTAWAGASLLGTHVGGYDEFVFDLTRAAGKTASVDLLVCCDSTPDASRSPSNLSDFCLDGGLYRPVELVYLPSLALDRLEIRQSTEADGPASLSILGRLYGAPAAGSAAIQVQVLDPGGALIHDNRLSRAVWQGSELLAKVDIAQPARWSPDHPQLYRCRVTLGSGETASMVEERIGIRHVGFPEQGLFSLNGKPLFLKGTQRHQDDASGAGAQPDASVRQEFGMMKAMGANFVRLAHYQQDRLVLDLCDELGLLVWEEAPWCRAGVGGPEWRKNTLQQMENLILQHFNHPSIVFWGLGNEDDWPEEQPSVDKEAIRGFMAELNEMSHRLDPGRLTSYRRCDFARDIPDVYSPSIWAGWYNGTYQEYAQSLAAQNTKQKRLLHIEWGADSHAGRHSEDPYRGLGHIATGTGAEERDGDFRRSGGAVRVSRDGDWSETYACDLFDWYLKTQETLPWLAGSAQWVFKDFASPLRAGSPIPRINQKGVLQRDLTPKESYAVFQSYWSMQPMIHIYGHTWPRRWGAVGERRVVKVYSNCAQAELFLNGISLGVRQRDAQNFPAANLRWEVTFRAGGNTLRAVGLHGASRIEDTIELEYVTQPWSAPAQLELRRAGTANGRVKVQAEVVDRDGLRCLDACTAVRFGVTGGVTMLCNLGTVGGSRVLEVSNGVAHLDVVRTGAGTVTVSAQGLPEAMVHL
jgi:beta-galactosidase